MRLQEVIFCVIVTLSSAFAVDLPCNFAGYPSPQAWFEVNAKKCSCSAFQATSFKPKITSYSSGLTNIRNDIGILEIISSPKLLSIPSGIENFFPDLEAIWIYSSKIKSVSQSDFKPFPKLIQIYFPTNEIHELSGDLFQYNPLIVRVYFNVNQLFSIGENLLDKLENFTLGQFGGCLGEATYTGKNQVSQFKVDVKSKCNSDLDGRELSYEVLNKKLETCEGNFAQSTFNWYMTEKKRNPEKVKDASVLLECHVYEVHTCELENLKTQSKSIPISEVKNILTNVTITEEIQKVEIVDQQVLFMPAGLGKAFQKLTELILIKSGLFFFDANDLENLEKLEVLNLTGNQIHEVSKKQFPPLEKLTKLDLSHNAIIDLDDGAFMTVASLEELYLDHNQLVTLHEKVFFGLSKLSQLTLNNNFLKYIGLTVFSPLKAITSIDLKTNDCIDTDHPTQSIEDIRKIFSDKCIAPVALNCWFSKVKIDLSPTKSITSYMCEAKEGFKIDQPKTRIFLDESIHAAGNEDSSVTAFVVRTKEVAFIPIAIPRTFSNLETLLVDTSGLTSILKHDFEDFNHLKIIAIRQNYIKVIDPESFDDVLQLEYLDLSHNRISYLPPKIFANLASLKTLIISSNPLMKLNYNILPQLSKIEEFQAVNCELDIVETKIVKSVKNAKIIDFRQNPCIDVEYKRGSMKFMEFFNEAQISCCHDECF